MAKILLAGDRFLLPSIMREALEQAGVNDEMVEAPCNWPIDPFVEIGEVREASGSEEQLIEDLRGCRVLFTHTVPVTRRVLEACPDLELVTVCRGGPVNVNVEAATELGVAVSYAPGRNAVSTAEHTLGMILAAVRRLPQRHEEIRAGEFPGDLYQFHLTGPEVRGSTVGLVGYGAIGSRVAPVLAAMGARVLVFDPYISDDAVAAFPEGVSRAQSLEEMLPQCGVLSIHARLTKDNARMIGREQIAALPAGAVLVNCARDGLLDYDAMCDALDSGHLWAAAIDVFPQEPLARDHRVRSTPNLVMTPHLAGASKQAALLAASIGARDIATFLAGGEPKYLQNPGVTRG